MLCNNIGVNEAGRLTFAGMDTVELAKKEEASQSSVSELEALKGELEEAFPGFDIYMAPLSLSVACHIGPGARAATVTKLLHIEDRR